MTLSRLYLCPTHGLLDDRAVIRVIDDRRRHIVVCPLAGCEHRVTGPVEYVRLTEALDAARTIATDRGHPQPRRERDLLEGLIRRRARQRKDTPA